MDTTFAVIVIVFVAAVVALVGYVLFEMSPLAHHVDRFRDARGKRIGGSPHL